MSEEQGERLAERRKLDDAWTIRVRDLSIAPNSMASLVVHRRDPDTGRSLDSAAVLVMTNATSGRLTFVYPAGPSVDLVATPQPFGGVRWWFVDPDGHGRCSTIIKPAGESRFASRKAWGPVSYRSQRIAHRRRAEAKVRAIRLALRGSPDLDAPFPPRPAGMHSRTYTRHQARAEAAAAIALSGRRPAKVTSTA